MIQQKTCYKCGQTKPMGEFLRRSGPKSNYNNICKICAASRAKTYSQAEGVRLKNRDRMRRYRADPAWKEKLRKNRETANRKSPKNAMKMAIYNARKRAAVDVTEDDLMKIWLRQNGRCFVTGIEMTWGRGRIEPTSISVDRIDSSKGYLVGNLRLVCHAVNCFRGRMTDAEMLDMAKAIVAHMEKTEPPLGLLSLVG